VQRSSTESRDTGHENAHAQQGKGSEQKKHEERGQDH
jgi:hypothetical protein